jgi:hypothetical protein
VKYTIPLGQFFTPESSGFEGLIIQLHLESPGREIPKFVTIHGVLHTSAQADFIDDPLKVTHLSNR